MKVIALHSNDEYLQATINFLKLHEFVEVQKIEIFNIGVYVEFIDTSWIQVSKRMLESPYMDKGI